MKSRPDFVIKKAYGVHPWYADAIPANWTDILRDYLANAPEAFVGEIGMDGIRHDVSHDVQATILIRQLDIAVELQRPVILHGAKAMDELIHVCRPYFRRIPGIMVHAFSGNLDQLRAWLDADAFISVGGGITRSGKLREIVRNVPDDRLLFETDSPDMFPDGGISPIPGTRLNQPSNLLRVRECIAK